jgi:hypothetical protein
MTLPFIGSSDRVIERFTQLKLMQGIFRLGRGCLSVAFGVILRSWRPRTFVHPPRNLTQLS